MELRRNRGSLRCSTLKYAGEMYIHKTIISGEMLLIGQVVQGDVEIDLKNGIVYIIGSFLCGCNSNLASVNLTI